MFHPLLALIAAGLVALSLPGCSYLCHLHSPLTPEEALLADLDPILSAEQRREMRHLETLDDMQAYVEHFWADLDPIPATSRNEYRDEYEHRLEYVRAHFPFRRGWRYSDQAIVYLKYGPPDRIYSDPWVRGFNLRGPEVKAVEVWVYDSFVPEMADNQQPGSLVWLEPFLMKFVFCDVANVGIYAQIYSNLPGENIHPRGDDLLTNTRIAFLPDW